MHEINFTVRLTGSKLFDIYAYNTAQKLCDKFPGLSFEYAENEIRIYGSLNDYWFNEWNRAVFEIGAIE